MARLLATIFFWVWMTFLGAGALVVVVVLYLPFVLLKALILTVTGRLHETTAIGNQKTDAASQQA